MISFMFKALMVLTFGVISNTMLNSGMLHAFFCFYFFFSFFGYTMLLFVEDYLIKC